MSDAVARVGVSMTDRTVEGIREVLAGNIRWHSPLLFAGPAVIASIAYMDPGNFATNIQAGARYGYALLWVVLVANVIAMLYQALSAKLGIVTGRNLAEMCRDHFPQPVVWRCGSSAKWRRWRPTSPSSSAARSVCRCSCICR